MISSVGTTTGLTSFSVKTGASSVSCEEAIRNVADVFDPVDRTGGAAVGRITIGTVGLDMRWEPGRCAIRLAELFGGCDPPLLAFLVYGDALYIDEPSTPFPLACLYPGRSPALNELLLKSRTELYEESALGPMP